MLHKVVLVVSCCFIASFPSLLSIFDSCISAMAISVSDGNCICLDACLSLK